MNFEIKDLIHFLIFGFLGIAANTTLNPIQAWLLPLF